jgi:hypothetical protein
VGWFGSSLNRLAANNEANFRTTTPCSKHADFLRRAKPKIRAISTILAGISPQIGSKNGFCRGLIVPALEIS